MSRRHAVSLIEVIIAAALLITLVAVTGRLATASQRVWQQTRYQQLAMDELANRMDYLLALPDSTRSEQISSLEVSPWIAVILPTPKLEGEPINDELGSRLRLRLRWGEGERSTSCELVGWIAAPTTNALTLGAES